VPRDIDYLQVSGWSHEARDKLTTQKPETLGRASRIPGVTPAAISLLLVYMKRRQGTSINLSTPESSEARQQIH
jgi:tRNA uridine 5-carboxymethylaminomethyl modification enzyme